MSEGKKISEDEMLKELQLMDYITVTENGNVIGNYKRGDKINILDINSLLKTYIEIKDKNNEKRKEFFSSPIIRIKKPKKSTAIIITLNFKPHIIEGKKYKLKITLNGEIARRTLWRKDEEY